MNDEQIDSVATLFKALADPTRLRILGAIAEAPLTGRELSERLALTPPTISHHMARLEAAGLVSVAPEAQRRRYTLNQGVLHTVSKRFHAPRSAGQSVAGAGEADDSPDAAFRRKVVRDFFVGGRLKQIPAQRKKRVAVLQQLLGHFEVDRTYTEAEVNDLLRQAHDDTATLRRELVDYGFMTRDRGVYRVSRSIPARGPTVAQEVGQDEQRWLRRLILGAEQTSPKSAGG